MSQSRSAVRHLQFFAVFCRNVTKMLFMLMREEEEGGERRKKIITVMMLEGEADQLHYYCIIALDFTYGCFKF